MLCATGAASKHYNASSRFPLTTTFTSEWAISRSWDSLDVEYTLWRNGQRDWLWVDGLASLKNRGGGASLPWSAFVLKFSS